MMRLMFVDDEPSVLEGLTNLLHRQRRIWDIVCCSDSTEALAMLEREHFDAVVSDMRMPQMDGAELLGRLKQLSPSTVRIILSGQADFDSVFRTLPVAHQFLAKPCEPGVLISVIERIHRLQSLLYEESIRSVVTGLDHLPSAPASYWELTRAIGDERADLGTIARIVERDVAMSLKVLQLASSAYFGRPNEKRSIEQAVSFLGLELLRGLALSARVFQPDAAPPGSGFDPAAFQDHSFRTAMLARRLASNRAQAEEAFIAGLLHDIGRLVLAQAFPEKCGRVAEIVRREARSRPEVERELLGTTHAEVGAHLIGTWGIALPVVEAVVYHHTPRECLHANPALALVHAASALTSIEQFGSADADEGAWDQEFLEQSGLAPRLEEWRLFARETPSPGEQAA